MMDADPLRFRKLVERGRDRGRSAVGAERDIVQEDRADFHISVRFPRLACAILR